MTAVHVPVPVGASPDANRRALYRVAGWGAILAGVCYVLQPALVMLLELTQSGQQDVYPSPAQLAGTFWRGVVEASIFTGIGIGLLVAVLGVGRLVRIDTAHASSWWGVAHVLGIVAAVGWLLMAGLMIGFNSSVARAVAEIGADEPTMRTTLHVGSIMVAGVLALVGIGSAGWLVGLWRAGRRSGVIGRPAAVVALAAAVVCVVPMFAAQPFGVLGTIPGFIVVGVSMLRRAR